MRRVLTDDLEGLARQVLSRLLSGKKNPKDFEDLLNEKDWALFMVELKDFGYLEKFNVVETMNGDAYIILNGGSEITVSTKGIRFLNDPNIRMIRG
ncbi:hypothetical protein [Clostridium sp. OS1-26]|uniref:hypothetical protein n=1 Tax=Clostridium sp. OS1-26 TaxID=3070681 RepID=UPI0027E15319|nr:hypothetical protein [Clostridium sp. OS1-26]WML35357.1 hypothetical protein RCG18_00930 [Clostridium sp. OS1-26]